ncbi:MAG TPA: MATE family efflux transporter [Haloplasmataceae bacterium]
MDMAIGRKYLFTNKDLLKLIIPLVIEQFLAISVGLADSIMVASVGESAVSAVSLVDNINILIINIFAALATGGAVVAGQYLGQKDHKQARFAANQLIILVSIISLIVMALLYVGNEFILNVVFGNIEEDVEAYSRTYMNIVLASIPFIALYNSCAALFRAMGNSKVTMIISVIMNLINAFGNAVLIYGFKLGVAGAAIPTLFSRALASIVILILLFNKRHIIHITRPISLKLNKFMVLNILHIGVPNGLENSVFQLGKILLLSLITSFGTASITANAVGNVVSSFGILPASAIGLALVSVVSQCVGARDYEQVRYYTKKLMKIAYLFMILINLIIFLGLPIILDIYNLSSVTKTLASEIIISHCLFGVLLWPLAFTLPNTLRASNDVKYAMIVSISSMWIFRMGLGFIFGKYLKMGVLGVWFAMYCDWLVRTIFFILRYRGTKWQIFRI